MNKTVVITGATSGIGLGCARKFAENGDRLILTGRNAEKLEAIKGELEEKLPGWTIVVAPNDATGLVKFMKDFK